MVKVNLLLFDAENVLCFGVEFFALFQNGFLVAIVIYGIGPKLRFQTKTATLGVGCLACLSRKKVSAVKLHAGQIGIAMHFDARFLRVGVGCMVATQAKVVVVATAILQL